MRFIITTFLACVFIAMTVSKSNAEDSLTVGNFTVKIGMLKDRVLSEYKGPYVLREVTNNTYLIQSSNPQSSDDFYGVIGFKNNKVNSVGKFWSTVKDDETVNSMKELYYLLKKMSVNNAIYVDIKEPGMSPGVQIYDITFTSRNSKIQLSIMDGSNTIGKVTVQEYVNADQQ